MTYDYFKVFKASIKYSHSIFFAKIKRKFRTITSNIVVGVELYARCPLNSFAALMATIL